MIGPKTEIRFRRDYRGVLTDETFYEAGTVVALPLEAADAIVGEGAAEFTDLTLAVDFEGLPLETLREMAKEEGVPNYWLMKEERLIAELRDD